MSARRLALTILTVLVALAGALLFSGAPALALSRHEYLSQLTGFQDPVSIAIRSNSEMYVAEQGDNVVDRINTAGTPLPFSASESYVDGAELTGAPTGPGGSTVPFEGLGGVAVDDSTGEIYVTNKETVDIFNSSGEYILQLTGVPSGAPINGSFRDGPNGLAVDQATSDLFVSTGIEPYNHPPVDLVAIFSPTGEYISEVPLTLQQPNPYGVAVNDVTGDLYVDSQYNGVHYSVEVFDALGKFLPPRWVGAGSPTGFEENSFFLALDQGSGHLYVTANNAVYEFGSSTSEIYEGKLTGTPDGPFVKVQDIAIDPSSGNLYVADSSGVVDIFGPDIATPPSLGSESFVEVGSGGATLGGRVYAGEAPVTYHFEYGTTDSYGSQTNAMMASGTFQASTQIEGLTPGTEYHFRLVVENKAGVVKGSDDTFITLPPSSVTEGLPDARVYEMVTPLDKEDAEVYVPDAESPENQAEGYQTTHLVEAATNGAAVVYAGEPTHNAEGESSGNGNGSDYLAQRLPSGGWTQTSIQPPGRRLTEYRGFSSDLSVGVLTSPTENPEQSELQLPGGKAPGGPKVEGEYRAFIDIYSHGLLGEDYQPLFTATPLRSPYEFGGGVIPDSGSGNNEGSPVYAGGSADMGQLLFETNDDLLEGQGTLQKELSEDVKQEMAYNQPELDYLYDWTQGRLSLVDVLPDGKVAQNSTFGAPHFPSERPSGNPPDFSHVISGDGSRIFWSTLEGGGYSPKSTALYVRENATQPQSPLNGLGECAVPTDACTIQMDKGIEGEGGARFWTASNDGSKAFFTKGSLYEYEVNPVGGRPGVLTDLTPGVEVQGVLGTSENGDYVYYVDGTGELRLLHEDGNTWTAPVSIAKLSGQDGYEMQPFEGLDNFALNSEGYAGDWTPDIGQRTAEVTPSGQGLVFMSNQNLKVPGFPNGYPNDGQEEVYIYNAAQNELFCASCSQSGEPGSSGFIPVSWSDSYIPTLISEGGDRVFFDSPTSLVSRDTNGKMDVYEWEREGSGSCNQGDGADGGCIYLLSGGTSNEPSWLLGASANGSDVFVITRADLTADAQDELYKLFDARVEGYSPVIPPACTGTGCQGVPASPPIFATPSSVTYNGVGNFLPPNKSGLAVKAKGKSLTREQKLTKALKACRGKAKRRRATCDAQAMKKYGIKSKTKRSASSKRGK